MLHTVLQKLRREKSKTQKQVATELGLTYQRYNHYETGKRQPDNDTLLLLSKYYGVSVDCLLGITDEHNLTEAAKHSNLTKGQKRMIETYERLSASDDPNAQIIKDTIDRLLGISGQEDDK